MPFDVKCPQCGSELEAPDAAAGKHVKCPDCGTRIAVPAGAEAVQPAPRPAERPAPPRDAEAVEEERPRRRRPRDEEDDYDDEDDRPRRRRRVNAADDGVSTLIPYKNGKALASYYCGVFSLILCIAPALGVIALVLGIQGLRYVRRHPEAHGTAHAWVGIILGGLTALVSWGGIIFFVVGMIIAATERSPRRSEGPSNPGAGKRVVAALIKADPALILSGPHHLLQSGMFSRDGQRVVTVGQEDVKVWDVKTGTSVEIKQRDVSQAAFTADGGAVVVAPGGGGGVASVYDAATGARLENLSHRGAPEELGFALALSPDGKTCVVAIAGDAGIGERLEVYDLPDGRLRQTLRVEIPPRKPGALWADGVRRIAFAADNVTVVVTLDDSVQLWDLTRMKERPLPTRGPPRVNLNTVLSPDGTTLAVWDLPEFVHFWGLEEMKLKGTLELPGDELKYFGLAIGPGGKTLATTRDGNLTIWDVGTGKKVVTRALDGGYPLAFSPDGTKLLYLGNDAEEVKVWDVAKMLEAKQP
jgi:hypothetical protein